MCGFYSKSHHCANEDLIGTLNIRAITPENITPELASEVLPKSLRYKVINNEQYSLSDEEKQNLLNEAAKIYQTRTPGEIERLWRCHGTFDMNQEANAVNKFDEEGQLLDTSHVPDVPTERITVTDSDLALDPVLTLPTVEPLYLRHTDERVDRINIRTITYEYLKDLELKKHMGGNILVDAVQHGKWNDPLLDQEKRKQFAAAFYKSASKEEILQSWRLHCNYFNPDVYDECEEQDVR